MLAIYSLQAGFVGARHIVPLQSAIASLGVEAEVLHITNLIETGFTQIYR